MIQERKNLVEVIDETGLKTAQSVDFQDREIFYKLQYKNFSVEKRYPNTVVGREELHRFKTTIDSLDKFMQYLKNPNSFNI